MKPGREPLKVALLELLARLANPRTNDELNAYYCAQTALAAAESPAPDALVAAAPNLAVLLFGLPHECDQGEAVAELKRLAPELPLSDGCSERL